MFKEDVTHNIYRSWDEMMGIPLLRKAPKETLSYRTLDCFTLEELNHLKWLIEQEIGTRVK